MKPIEKCFAIRADGNEKLGSGHIMRCLSIAKQIRRAGKDCVFITADTSPAEILLKSGFEFICLDSSWNDLEGELPKICRIIRERTVATILIDSYFVTGRYLSDLCAFTQVAYIDDLDSFTYPCHALINYNCYAENIGYEKRYNKTPLLLGTKYAPLREEFSGVPLRAASDRIRSALITTGGADPANVSGKLITKLAARPWFSGIIFHVVAGGFNMHLDDLRRMQGEHDNIRMHVNTGSMARLMCESDIAVSAGGSTMYELCACGVPTVCFAFADNQLPGVREFSSRGLMEYAGDIRENEDACLEKICGEIERLDSSSEIRAEMSRKMRSVVDGYGAQRIAKFLIKGEKQ